MENDEPMKLILKQLKKIEASTLTQKKLFELTTKTVLDTADVGLIFNRINQSIITWCKKKQLAHTKINGRYFFIWDAILDLFNSKFKL